MSSSGGVVEGISTLELVHKRSKQLNLEMPLTHTIYDLIFGIITQNEALEKIMNQKLGEEYPPTFEDLLEWLKLHECYEIKKFSESWFIYF